MQIHQIWLDVIIPEKIQVMMATWRTSGNEYKLWRKEDLVIYNEELAITGMQPFHESLKSDLYRLLILRDFGGLYVDCDATLTGSIPSVLPEIFCGHFQNDLLMPDPWMIYSSCTNHDLINKLISEGAKMSNDQDPLHRFGYKAFIRKWNKEILDTRAWAKHANLYSWRNSKTPSR